jgi:hypothetical protein
MNVPRKMHGMMSDDIIYTPHLVYYKAKKLPERYLEMNLTNNTQQHDLLDIPQSIRNMRKSKDWVKTWNKLQVIDKDDDNYMSRLMKRILLGSSSKATVNIIPLGIIQQSELLQNANYSTAKSSKNSWFSKREKYMNNDSYFCFIICFLLTLGTAGAQLHSFLNINSPLSPEISCDPGISLLRF